MKYHRIKLAITERCNLDCVHCYMKKKSSKCMDVEYAQRILGEARELGVEVVDLTGGEPSLHPNFSTIVENALSLGFGQVNICTNGYALDTKMFRDFDPTNIHFFISMDGISEDVVRRIRGECVSGIMKVFDELKQLKLRFSLRFCLNTLNWNETADMLAFAEAIGVDAAFEPTQIVGNAGKDLVLSCEQMSHVGSIIERFPKSGIAIEDSFAVPFPCDGGQADLLSIDTDGIATVCLMMGVNRQILSQSGLKEMWDKLRKYKERMKNFLPNMERCNECPHHDLCLSGCRATAYTLQCFDPWKEGD